MRIGVDGRHLGAGRGVAHYTSALLTAFGERFPEDEWRTLVPRGAGDDAAESSGVHLVHHRLPSRLLFGPAALFGRPRLDELLGGGLDVVWIPAPAPVAVSKGVPYVLTVHDLSWLERPEDFTRYERLWHGLGRLRGLARRARVVVAASNATKDVITSRWSDVDPERIHVVHPPIAALPRPKPLPGHLPARYILSVGALEPRKAPDLLLHAWERARARGLQADLVFAGTGRLARKLKRPGVHIVGQADRQTLATLYANALALALPSHAEGFGMTPLEAGLLGTPSIVSDIPATRESVGDHAVRVPPGDEAEWTKALLGAGSGADPAAVKQQAEHFTQAAPYGMRAAFEEAANA